MITSEVVKKLMALALNNPSEEEAQAAALKALRMIDKYQIPVGDIVISPSKWEAPETDFMRTVEEILKKADKPAEGSAYGGDSIFDNEEAYNQQTPGALKLRPEEAELEDQQSAVRRQVVRAWRAIREARKALKVEIDRYEKETHRKFTGNGRWI